MESSAPELSQALEHFTASCHAAGERATPQRIAVYRTLIGLETHPGPEEIFQVLRAEMPTISLATVYKTLDFLESRGFVRQVAVEGPTRRYDAKLTPHSHLVCRSCRVIFDVVGLETGPEAVSDVLLDGFTPEAVEVQVVGLCADCAAAPENEARRAPRKTPGES